MLHLIVIWSSSSDGFGPKLRSVVLRQIAQRWRVEGTSADATQLSAPCPMHVRARQRAGRTAIAHGRRQDRPARIFYGLFWSASSCSYLILILINSDYFLPLVLTRICSSPKFWFISTHFDALTCTYARSSAASNVTAFCTGHTQRCTMERHRVHTASAASRSARGNARKMVT